MMKIIMLTIMKIRVQFETHSMWPDVGDKPSQVVFEPKFAWLTSWVKWLLAPNLASTSHAWHQNETNRFFNLIWQSAFVILFFYCSWFTLSFITPSFIPHCDSFSSISLTHHHLFFSIEQDFLSCVLPFELVLCLSCWRGATAAQFDNHRYDLHHLKCLFFIVSTTSRQTGKQIVSLPQQHSLSIWFLVCAW